MKIEKNKKYWLCLEPTTFVFNGKEEYVLYNSLSKKMLVFKNSANSKNELEVLKRYENMSNMYSLLFSGQELEDLGLVDFVEKIRIGYFGDLLPEEFFTQKPVVFPPVANVKNSIENLQKDPELSGRQTYLRFLHEISIYLNGDCNRNCALCNQYKNQFLYCTKHSQHVPVPTLSCLFNTIRESFITKVNLIGGDVFLYEHFDDLLIEINNTNASFCVYSHYANVNTEKAKTLFECRVDLHVLVPASYDRILLEELSLLLKPFQDLTYWIFIVEAVEEFSDIQTIIHKMQLKNTFIKPFYNGNNLQFFKEMVYTTFEDIEDAELDANDIFARQRINVHYYGTLIFTPDKEIRTCFHLPKQKHIGFEVIQMVKQELNSQSAWFLTRDKLKPCSDCAYKFLCPPPSNYELAIGKPNLCTISACTLASSS